MKTDALSSNKQNDAEIFAIVESFCDLVRADYQNDMTQFSSDGAIGFTQDCMRVARDFLSWADQWVDFDELGEVWPYFLSEHFARTLDGNTNGLEYLSTLDATHWPVIAEAMGCPLRSEPLTPPLQYTTSEKECAAIVDQLCPVFVHHTGAHVSPKCFNALVSRLNELTR
jgi:hypothetical protein